MNIFRRVFFVCLFFYSSTIYSINSDTSKIFEKGSQTQWFTEKQLENFDSVNFLNSSLKDFHKYIFKSTLGNTGLGEQDPTYRPLRTSIGFVYSRNHYSSYYNIPEKLKFYNSKAPYTDLFYVAGANKEQLFKGSFSYNFEKNWNITAEFCRIRSEGAYLRQSTNDNFISLSSNYKTKNNRYWLLSSIIYNSIKTAENGGISDDSLFENFENIDEKLLPVNLTSAKRSVENANVTIKQILNFGNKSVDTNSLNYIIPSSRLILSSSFDFNSLKYQDYDPTSDFYPTIYYDSIVTFDSTFYSKIENELSWKRTDNLKHLGFKDLLGIAINLKHQLINVNQRSLEATFSNLIGGFELYNTYSTRSFWWNLSSKYVFDGYNKDDYQVELALKKASKDSLISIGLNIESKLKRADFIYNRFLSNHFQWDNHFDKSSANGLDVSFKMNKIKLETNISFYNYNNILYFDTAALPKQYEKSIGLFSVAVKKDFTLYNWHLDNKVIYQYVPDNSIIRVPNLISENSIYYQNYLFKKALLLQIGVSVFYTTSYYSNAYMPATDQFYLQNNKKCGDYPFIDFFINAKIKTVRIFFKIDHLNSGFSGKKYVLTPGYPYPERAFKFGVSWRFFD